MTRRREDRVRDRGRDRRERRLAAARRRVVRVEEVHVEPELTGMQVAWQMAQDRAKKAKDRKSKRFKSGSMEQEELLDRTLKKRLPTGA